MISLVSVSMIGSRLMSLLLTPIEGITRDITGVDLVAFLVNHIVDTMNYQPSITRLLGQKDSKYFFSASLNTRLGRLHECVGASDIDVFNHAEFSECGPTIGNRLPNKRVRLGSFTVSGQRSLGYEAFHTILSSIP
jgi:hypothetical protein